MAPTLLSAFCDELLAQSASPVFHKFAEHADDVAALAGVGAGVATLSRVPQVLASKAALKAVRAIEKHEGRLPLKDRIKAMIEHRHIILPGSSSRVQMSVSPRTHKVLPGTKRLYLSPTASRSTLEHELGHLRDPHIIGPISRNRHLNTYRTLRNELVANASSIRRRGVKQVPMALASYGTYLTQAAYNHPRLAAVGAGTLTAATARRLLAGKKHKAEE